jgi:hypothetical protein
VALGRKQLLQVHAIKDVPFPNRLERIIRNQVCDMPPLIEKVYKQL